MLASFLAHFFHYFYIPINAPWYTGNVWGNVFVILIVGPLGWVWSKSKFWPLKPLKKEMEHLHEKHDLLHELHISHAKSLEELHKKLNDLMK